MTKEETAMCKGIAIIMMLFHHLFYSLNTYSEYEVDYTPFGYNYTYLVSFAFKACVTVFVFLTAYGISRQFILKSINNENELRKYTIKRYFKLMSGYWFIFILTWIMEYIPGGGYSKIQNYGEDIFKRAVNLLIDFMGVAHILGTPTHNPTWWYMSWAITLIFLIPFIIKMSEKYSAVVIMPLMILVPLYFSGNGVFITYIIPVCAGIIFAQNSLFEKLKDKRKMSGIFRVGEMIISIAIGILGIYFRERIKMYFIWDTIIAINVCVLCQAVFYNIRILKQGLEFLGESNRSMNIFMTHTFIFLYWFKDFIYSWKYPIVILIVFIISSVILSEIIEGLKKILRFDRYVEGFINKVSGE